MMENQCFYRGFISTTELLAYFDLALCGGLRARLVRVLLSIALKTIARIKLLHGHIAFCALAPAGSNPYFLSQRDLEGAQDTFFERCEITSKTNGNSPNRSLYDILNYENIQNPPRIISKIETLDFAQFDRLPRAPN